MKPFKRLSWLCLLLLIAGLLSSPGCVRTQERLCFVAPSQLPFTTREMKTAGFWIARHPSPDKIVMTVDEIRTFNTMIIQELRSVKDLFSRPKTISARELRNDLGKVLDAVQKRELFDENGQKAAETFFKPIRENLDLDDLPADVEVKYGLVVSYADQRVLPTPKALNEIANDIDFDELQNNALEVGTPVRILHESLDQKWFYVESPASDGWVARDNIATGAMEEIQNYFSSQDIVVVTKAKAAIFLNSEKTEYAGYAQMGTRFPFQEINDATAQVSLPYRNDDGSLSFKSGYFNAGDIHLGYLPYTARNILQQAFELLDKPYGWGGMYGEQDCSRFLQEVFATVGIDLPRNSSEQAKLGLSSVNLTADASDQEKLKALEKNAVGGITLLPMKGHIMLFLGFADGRPYAIHAVWAFRQNLDGKDIVRVINRVAISDLSLGEGSHKGSLIKRLKDIRVLAK